MGSTGRGRKLEMKKGKESKVRETGKEGMGLEKQEWVKTDEHCKQRQNIG